MPVDRTVYVGWEETQVVPTVVLLTLDANVTTVNLGTNGGGSTAFAAATGTTSTDADGARTGNLMLPKGITATMNGTALSSMNLRVTEYTVGVDGPARMPASLPPASGYTYAVEISADEALATNSKITFNKPAYFYVDNFLNGTSPGALHPAVGTAVPSGYYDRDLRAWVPSANGVVIKVLKGKQTIAAGSPAEIDVTGDDVKDDVTNVAAPAAIQALGFTDDELIALQAYDDDKTFWRVPIDHMTPWDFNYGRSFSCDGQCRQPLLGATPPDPPKCQSSTPGSIIGCEAQSLGETLKVAGTPFSLNYDTSRLPLYSNWRTLTMGIRAIPDYADSSWSQARVTVSIAGKVVFANSYGAGPYLIQNFDWDGLDAFGRPVIGSATATIEGDWYGEMEYLEYIDGFGKVSTQPTFNF